MKKIVLYSMHSVIAVLSAVFFFLFLSSGVKLDEDGRINRHRPQGNIIAAYASSTVINATDGDLIFPFAFISQFGQSSNQDINEPSTLVLVMSILLLVVVLFGHLLFWGFLLVKAFSGNWVATIALFTWDLVIAYGLWVASDGYVFEIYKYVN